MKKNFGVSVVAVILGLVAVALAQGTTPIQPIPPRYDGHLMGSPTAPVQLEIFIDFMCPDSAQVWPTIKQVQQHYGQQRLLVNVHVFPLPYHRNAYLAAEAGLVIEAANSANFFKWTELIFQKQALYYNAPSMNLTTLQVIQAFGQLVSSAGLMDSQTFVSAMTNVDAPYDWNSRVSWKWAAARGIYGTPMFMVNGVIVPQIEPDWTQQEFIELLDPVFGTSAH